MTAAEIKKKPIDFQGLKNTHTLVVVESLHGLRGAKIADV